MIDLKDFNKEIVEGTNIKVHGILEVIKNALHYHSKIVQEYQLHLEAYTTARNQYAKLLSKETLRNVMSETDINLYTIFKAKEEKEVQVRYSAEAIENKYDEMCLCKNRVETIEKIVEYLKAVSNNCRTILEYEKFRAGK